MSNVSPVSSGGDGPSNKIANALSKMFGLFGMLDDLSNAGKVELEREVKTTTDRETGVKTTVTHTTEEYDPRKAREALTSPANITRITDATQAYIELLRELPKMLRPSTPESSERVIDGETGTYAEEPTTPNIFDLFKGAAKAQPRNPLNRLATELGIDVDTLCDLVKQFADQRKSNNEAELEKIFLLVSNFDASGILDGVKTYIAQQNPLSVEDALKRLIENQGGLDKLVDSILSLKLKKEEQAKKDQLDTERNQILEKAYQLRAGSQSDHKPSLIVSLETAISELVKNNEVQREEVVKRHGGYETLISLLRAKES